MGWWAPGIGQNPPCLLLLGQIQRLDTSNSPAQPCLGETLLGALLAVGMSALEQTLGVSRWGSAAT